MILKRIRTEFFSVYLHDKVCLKWLESFQTHFHVYSSLYIPHYALLFTFLNYLCIFHYAFFVFFIFAELIYLPFLYLLLYLGCTVLHLINLQDKHNMTR